jgi:hypothetical protein
VKVGRAPPAIVGLSMIQISPRRVMTPSRPSGIGAMPPISSESPSGMGSVSMR